MNRKNFTLIELAVALAIIALMGASLMVSFSGLGGAKLDSGARQIITDISWARETAIATHEHRAISFDLANSAYSVFRSPGGVAADFIGNNLLKRVVLGVSLSLIQANLWVYSPRGNIFGPNTVTLTSGGRTRQVRIFPEAGYAKIE